MTICVIAVVSAAPCQCFSPDGRQMTSLGRISSMRPPSRWARPQPVVTMSVWPSGSVGQAVRPPSPRLRCDRRAGLDGEDAE